MATVGNQDRVTRDTEGDGDDKGEETGFVFIWENGTNGVDDCTP